MLSTLLGLAWLGAMGAAGVVTLRRTVCSLTPLEKFAYGVPVGVVGGSLLLLLGSIAFGLSAGLVWVIGLACFAFAVIAGTGGRTGEAGARLLSGARSSRALIDDLDAALGRLPLLPTAVIGFFIVRWALLWKDAFYYQAGALWAGQSYLWADWALHLGDITSFAYGDNFPPQEPRFAGHPFSYHYLASITAAGMVKLGMNPATALVWQSFLFSCLIALGLYALARRLTGSQIAASLTLPLFFLGGGLGWILTLGDAARGPGLTETLQNNPWNFDAQMSANFVWRNMYFALIEPQRPYLYGLPLAFLTLSLLLVAVKGFDRRYFLAAGIVAGLLPLAHLGSFLALVMITPFLFVLFPSWRWAWFFGAWIVVAVPQLLSQLGEGGGLVDAIRWQVGWVAEPDAWPWFWLKNLGWFIPLLLLALADRTLVSVNARRFLWAMMPIFLIGNVAVFQPWDWDNTKVLMFWFLGTCILVAALLAKTWEANPSLVVRTLVVGVLLSMTLSGILENLHQLEGKQHYELLSKEEVDLAADVRSKTDPHAIFAVGLQHNHPIPMLTGRRVPLSFLGWASSHGQDYGERERDLRSIYSLTPDTPELLKKNDIDYVVIGPNERNELHANEAGFRTRYPVIAQTQNYVVFDVRQASAAARP